MCVTNRKLCKSDFLKKIEEITKLLEKAKTLQIAKESLSNAEAELVKAQERKEKLGEKT